MADGTLIFDTAIDSGGFKQDAQQLSGTAAQAVSVMASGFASVTATINGMETEFRKFTEQIAKSADPKPLKETADGVEEIGEKAKSSASSFDMLKNSISVALGNIAAQAIGKITGMLAEIPKQAVAVGSAFETSMSQVAATMGIPSAAEEFEVLSNAAKEMGESTKFSASQAGEALNYLALAGYSAEKAVEALPTVLNVAAAGGMELAAASDMITDAMSALGLETKDMSSFADKLAVTAQKSNTSVSQLGQAILTVGGTAKMLSGGVTEMNTALGILADNGIKGAEGGTALRNIIVDIGGKTKPAREALAQLGVSAYDAQGNMRPLVDTFADFKEALSQVSNQDRTRLLTDIFGAMDLKAVNALIDTSSSRFEELSGQIENCAGAASEMAATMNDNLQGDITIMKSGLEGLGIEAFEKFQEPMRTAVQAVTKEISSLTNSVKNGELSDSFDKAAAAMGTLIEKGAELLSGRVIPGIINGIALLADNLNTIIPAAEGAAAAFVSFKAATAALTAVSAVSGAGLAGITASLVAMAPAAIAAGAALAIVGTAAAEVAEINADIALFESGEKTYSAQVKAADELAKSLEDVRTASQAVVDEKDKELSKLEALKGELSKHVDANGKITGSYQQVKEIVSEINKLYPEEMTITGNKIEDYGKLCGAVDDYIAKLREQALYESKKDVWQTALVTKEKAEEREKELLENEKEAKERVRRARQSGDKNLIREAEGALSAAGEALSKNHQIILQADRDITDFEDMLTTHADVSISPVPWIAQHYLDQAAEDNENAIKAAEESFEDFKAAWKDMEHRYAMGEISEEGLYKRQTELLTGYGHEDDEEMWSYYEKNKSTGDKISDQKKKDIEQRVKDEAQAKKEAEKEAASELQDKWDAVSDDDTLNAREKYKKYLSLYDEYAGKIGSAQESFNKKVKSAKKAADKEAEVEAKEAKKAQEKIIGEGLADILAKHKEAYKELEKARESYRNKLLSVGGSLFKVEEKEDAFGNKTRTYTVNNIKAQLSRMKTLHGYIKKLKERGVSNELLKELISQPNEDAVQFAKYMSRMSAAEFGQINEAYKQKNELAKSLSDDLYKSEAQKISDAMDEELAEFSTTASDYGAMSATEFADAWEKTMKSKGLYKFGGQLEAAGANRSEKDYAPQQTKGAKKKASSSTVNLTTTVMLDGIAVGKAAKKYILEENERTGG